MGGFCLLMELHRGRVCGCGLRSKLVYSVMIVANMKDVLVHWYNSATKDIVHDFGLLVFFTKFPTPKTDFYYFLFILEWNKFKFNR